MNEEIYNKFIVYNIQRNYKFLSDYLIKLQDHINYCYKNNIINLYKRNIIYGKIYDLVKELNIQYNKFIISNISNIYILLNKYLDLSIENDKDLTFKIYRQYLKNIYSVNLDKDLNKILYPLDDQREKIIFFSKQYGCTNMKDIIELLIKLPINYIFNYYTNIYIDYLNKIFIPLNFIIKNTLFKKQDENIEIMNNSDEESCFNLSKYIDNINIYLKKNNNDNLLNKLVCIELKYNKQTIILEGIIKEDPGNIYIRTSQISNKLIYFKKKNLEADLLKCRATQKFSKKFFKTLTNYEILVYNHENFILFIDESYDKYMALIAKPFMTIMKEFIKKKNTITEMFTTIRLLLLGNEENINIAGLLFELTKEKKNNYNMIYNLIYNNLSYINQIKLKKVILTMKDELQYLEKLTLKDVNLKKQILVLKNIPASIKSLALEKVEEMKSSNNEYYKQLLYVKTLIKFPWSSNEDDIFFEDLNLDFNKRKNYIMNVENKLNILTYGHKKAKQHLLQIIGKWITNPKSGGSVISLVGPPGVGKTLLAKSIGDALDIPFAQITLGGQNDGELLHGHGYTYSGSQPGMIIKKMNETGKSRCILYFDELDKICSKNGTNEISNILIHLTDPNMNKSFQDRFFQGIDFPLDKVIMIFSYNDSSSIDPILLDRFKEIKIQPYSIVDKLIIFKKFIFIEICKIVGFNHKLFNLSDDIIKFIIYKYTNEAGVRNLKRKIEQILLDLNVDRLYQRGLFKENKKSIKITKKLIENILNKSDFTIQVIHKNPEVGIINGLYATNNGNGGIVPIQIFTNFVNNNYNLKFTGCQGDIMKESVECALTCAIDYIERNQEKYGITDFSDFIEKKCKYGFHIHAPNGATPKDGPSAGCAFTCAFISRILNKPINNTLGMTGEIDLLGNVTKIGGLEYKINGAIRAGIKIIILSNENKDDYINIKKKNKLVNKINIIFVDKIDEVIDYLFINNS